MKKQLLFLSVFIFSLNTMDVPTIEKAEQENIAQESSVSSLLHLCAPVVASQFDIQKAKEDFAAGREIKKPNVSVELHQLLAAQLIKTHPVIPEILSNMSFNLSISETDTEKIEWLQCDAIEHNGNEEVDWYNQDGKLFVHRNLKDYSTAYTAYIYSNEKNEKKLITSLPIGYIFVDGAWSPDSSKIALMHPSKNYFEIWDVYSGKLSFRIPSNYRMISWSQDGQSIKIGGRNIFILSELLEKENMLKICAGSNFNPQYIERALLLMLASDKKQQKSWYPSGLDISTNQNAQKVFDSFDPEIQQILIEHFRVKKEHQKSNCLIS